MERDARVNIWELSDLATPWCLHVAVTLRVAEHLDAGLATIDELAAAAGANADALQRVLRHLANKGLFEEPETGRFALNDPARELLEPSARLGLDLEGFGGRMAQAWTSLLTAVRTGESAYHTVFGRPFWEDLQAHPAIGASFDAMMGPAGHGTPDVNIPLGDGGWRAVRRIVDVGGGTGALLTALLRAHPHLHGTLVDLPSTIARAREALDAAAAAGVADAADAADTEDAQDVPDAPDAAIANRLTMSGQSFFDPLPSGADVYLLKSIIVDWPDREAIAILTRCAEAARAARPAAGRVIILNGVCPDADGPPAPEVMMLVLVGASSARCPSCARSREPPASGSTPRRGTGIASSWSADRSRREPAHS